MKPYFEIIESIVPFEKVLAIDYYTTKNHSTQVGDRHTCIIRFAPGEEGYISYFIYSKDAKHLTKKMKLETQISNYKKWLEKKDNQENRGKNEC